MTSLINFIVPPFSYTPFYSFINLTRHYLLSKQPLSRPQQLNQQGEVLEAAIEAAANAVIKLKDSLNEWDGKVGDGDCGSTVSPLPLPLRPESLGYIWFILI